MPCPICNQEHTESVEEALDRLQTGPARLLEALAGASEAQLDAAPPGKWSSRQIAVHLLDTEIVVAARVRKILSEEGATLLTMDQDRIAATCTAGRSVPHVLKTFEALRLDNVDLLRATLAAGAARYGIHPDFGRLTLRDLVLHFSFHDAKHCVQIRRLLGKPDAL